MSLGTIIQKIKIYTLSLPPKPAMYSLRDEGICMGPVAITLPMFDILQNYMYCLNEIDALEDLHDSSEENVAAIADAKERQRALLGELTVYLIRFTIHLGHDLEAIIKHQQEADEQFNPEKSFAELVGTIQAITYKYHFEDDTSEDRYEEVIFYCLFNLYMLMQRMCMQDLCKDFETVIKNHWKYAYENKND